MNRWIKARKAGITAEVVEEIKRIWRFHELAMVKIVDPLKRNMDRAREIVEVGNVFLHNFPILYHCRENAYDLKKIYEIKMSLRYRKNKQVDQNDIFDLK